LVAAQRIAQAATAANRNALVPRLSAQCIVAKEMAVIAEMKPTLFVLIKTVIR